jgi:hypothetical protein
LRDLDCDHDLSVVAEDVVIRRVIKPDLLAMCEVSMSAQYPASPPLSLRRNSRQDPAFSTTLAAAEPGRRYPGGATHPSVGEDRVLYVVLEW